jgi:CheY-like chemotaxis protein
MSHEQSGMLHTIETCGNAMLSLVGGVLDLSRLERNMVQLALAPFDVSRCIEEALAIASHEAFGKVDPLYEIDFGGRPSVIVGDSLRVRQILINLLSNAIKFTDKKDQVVLVRAVRSSDEMITFSVQDAGIGIEQSALVQVFGSFSQANTSIGKTFGGTGLGLSIVKALVELMGGTVGVKSQTGVGSLFHFTIPAAIGAYSDADVQERNRRQAAIQMLAGKTATVSLANEAVANNLRARLEAFGIRMLSSTAAATTSSDLQFVDIADKFPVTSRLVIVDWARPVGWSGPFLRKPIQTKALLVCLVAALHLQPWPATRVLFSEPLTTILIVEDNMVCREVVVRLLRKLGYPDACVFTANDGSEALAFLERKTVDVVLLDVMMPVMNGLQAARQIRISSAAGNTTSPYLIGLTAAATEESKIACIEAGMDSFLTKPVRAAELAKVLDEANDRRRSGIASASRTAPAATSVA